MGAFLAAPKRGQMAMELAAPRPVTPRGLRGAFGELVKMASGPERRKLEPRKGGSTTGINVPWRDLGATADRRPTPPNFFVPVPALRNMADRDTIIFAIRRTLRMAIGELRWRIVPDLDAVKADLKRWQMTVMINLAMPDLNIPFVPQSMSLEIYTKATRYLFDLLNDVWKESRGDPNNHGDLYAFASLAQKDPRVRDFFENIAAAHEAIAQSHIPIVQGVFERPNPSAESSFRPFLSQTLDDVTLFDGAAIVKVPQADGKVLGEMYCIPGEQVRLYRKPDLSTPQPPHIAYDWADDYKVKAIFNNDELVYVMANPQLNGYGKSPVSLLVEMMAGAIYGNANMYDEFVNRNLPYFVFDLGPNVSQPDKDAVEQAWYNKVVQGAYRGIFVAMKEGVKGFMPMPTPPDKTDSTIARLQYWANVKCAVYGLSLNDIGFTQDLHRTTADTQADLTQSRGINSFANITQGYYNGEIVHGRMWVRDDPENEESLAGKSVPCFPFQDVKFEFEHSSPTQRIDEANKLIPFSPVGAITINEMRKEMGYPPVPGGDVPTVQISAATLTRVDALPDLPTDITPGDPAAAGSEQGQGALPGGQPAPRQDGRSEMQGQGGQRQDMNQSPQEQVAKGVESIERLAKSLAECVTNGGDS